MVQALSIPCSSQIRVIFLPVRLQGEMILRLAERARRFETEEEKVLPFYASSLTEEEAANVAAAIQDPPSHKLAKVSGFLHFSSFPQVFPIIWGRRNGFE